MKVSVIVPVYNDHWLPECLSSIPKDVELIVVHDPTQRGPGWARNQGLAQVTGNLVFFADADDEVGNLNALIDAQGRRMADWTIGSFVKLGLLQDVVQDFDHEIMMSRQEVGGYIRRNLANPRYHQMLSGCWGKLFRMRIIREHNLRFDESLRTAEDLDFNYRYLDHCKSVCFSPVIAYRHIKREGSLTTRPSEAMLDVLKVLNRMERYGDIGHSFIYHSILYVRRAPHLAGIIMRHPDFRKHIERYVPATGNYRFLPWLMKLGFVKPVELAARL